MSGPVRPTAPDDHQRTRWDADLSRHRLECKDVSRRAISIYTSPRRARPKHATLKTALPRCRSRTERGKREAEIGRSVLAVVSSLVVFASLPTYLAVLLVFEGVILPAVIGVFCGFAAATLLDATEIPAQRTEREPTGDQDDPDHDGRTRRAAW